MKNDAIVDIIHKLVDVYYEQNPSAKFVPGSTHVPVTRKLYTSDELIYAIDAVLDGVWTGGEYVSEFEKRLSVYVGTRYALTTASGSSANLLATIAVSEYYRKGVKNPEVITMAAGFPTTVFPIIQAGMTPHFVDISLPTYGPNMTQLEQAIGSNTVGIILAHTLGNPFDLDAVVKLCGDHELWLIEDCCDALGSKYNGRRVGTFGNASTFSFYPAHHITTGEGGAVLTSSAYIKRLIESYAWWGRDCWCDPGKDGTCNNRYGQQFGDLPDGYDHKYVYTKKGYRLAMTDMQAAIGVQQMDKLDWFSGARRGNFWLLHDGLKRHEEFFILPEATKNSDPSWFGFPLTIREDAPFTRTELINYLEKARIDSRLLFAGNITKQPVMMRERYIAEDLTFSDIVMNQALWIGVHPSLTGEMIDYMIESFDDFIKEIEQ